MLIPIGALAGFIGLFVYTCVATSKETSAAKRYLADLEAGRMDQAYAMLVAERRRDTTLEAYRDAPDTRVLAASKSFSWRKTEGPNERGLACVVGHIVTSAGDRGIHIYLVDEEGEAKVHTVLVYDASHVPPSGPWFCDGH